MEPERATYREQDGNGLYFRVKPNGQKSWELRYKKPDGKWSWLGLGGYPEISGSLARQKAAQLRERRIDSRNLEIHTLDQKIDRLEALANRESLAAGYLSAMATWKADEMELNEKRNSMETRLQQVRQKDK